MSAYKVRSYADFIPRFPPVPSDPARPVARLANGEKGEFLPVASPALAMQASLAARLAGQGTDMKHGDGLSPLSRIAITLLLAIASWLPIVGLVYFLLR